MGNLREAVLEIRGLECSACARRAEETLRALPGVEAANVSVIRDRVRISFDGRRTSVREIVAGLGRAGYRVRAAPKIPRQRSLAGLGVSAVAFANLLAIDHLAGDVAPRSCDFFRLGLAALVICVSGIPLWIRAPLAPEIRSPRGQDRSTLWPPLGRDQLALLGAIAAFAVGVLELGIWRTSPLARIGLGPDALRAARSLGFETAAGIILATCLVRVAATALAAISRADLGARDRAEATSARRIRADGSEEIVRHATLAHGARVKIVEGERAPVDLELLVAARVSIPAEGGAITTADLHAGARIAAGAVLLSGEAVGRVIRDRAAVATAMDAEVHRALDRIDADAVRPRPFAWSAVAAQTILVASMSFAAFAVFLHACIGGDAGRPTAVLAAIAVLTGCSTAAFSLAAPIARGIAVLRARAGSVVVKDAEALIRLASADVACFDEIASVGGAARSILDRGVGCRILSADPAEIAAPAAHRLGLACSAGLSPLEKARAAAEIQRRGGRVILVSRGGAVDAGGVEVNVALAPDLLPAAVDAPIVINGGPDRLGPLLDLGRELDRRLRENAAIAAVYNASVIPVAVLGWISPLQAAGLLLIEAAIVLGNAARILFPGETPRAIAAIEDPRAAVMAPPGPPDPKAPWEGRDTAPARA